MPNYFRPVQRVSGAAGAPASCTPLKRTCPDYSTMLLNTAALSGFHQLQTPLLQSQLQQLPSRQIIQLPGAASYMSVTCTSHVVVTCTSHINAWQCFRSAQLVSHSNFVTKISRAFDDFCYESQSSYEVGDTCYQHSQHTRQWYDVI